MKNISTKWWIIGVVVLIVGMLGLSQYLQSNDPGTLARNGLHWHPEITIYVKGEKIEIPQNIGIGAVHQPMHTHDDLPIIHLEFSGVVKEKDATLGNFFRIWGKDIRSLGTNVKMTVNGKENMEFENYIMQDKDKIELRYE